ncbi:hypothetical protein FCV25MIE_08367 [Fagus crenata]
MSHDNRNFLFIRTPPPILIKQAGDSVGLAALGGKLMEKPGILVPSRQPNHTRALAPILFISKREFINLGPQRGNEPRILTPDILD